MTKLAESDILTWDIVTDAEQITSLDQRYEAELSLDAGSRVWRYAVNGCEATAYDCGTGSPCRIAVCSGGDSAWGDVTDAGCVLDERTGDGEVIWVGSDLSEIVQ